MNEALRVMQEQISKIESAVAALNNTIANLIKEAETTPVVGQAISEDTKILEFEQLKTLLENPAWPTATNPDYIINAEQDKEDRAEGILEILIDVHLEGLKFLDFGCGEGHVVNRAAKTQSPVMSIGYDIAESPRWREFANEKTKFTTDWKEVIKNGPYNVILIYDVLDHIVNEDPVQTLKRIKQVLKPNGKVFARLHPFCSRHATHLYNKLNKAFIHLVFNEDEIKKLELEPQKVNKIIHPSISYNEMFAKAGFRLAAQPQVTKEAVEPFFVNTPLVAQRIKSHWAESHEQHLRNGTGFPIAELEQQFLDYVII